MPPRRTLVAACMTLAALVLSGSDGPGAPEFDPAGQRAGRFEGGGSDTLGTPCGSCADPAISAYFGLEFRGDEMWMVARDGTMYRTLDCAVLETVSIQGFRGFATDLGWDSRRDLFFVTDPELARVLVVRADGVVVHDWPSPLDAPIGAAYDSTRDVYWIADWFHKVIHAVDPETGVPGASFTVPEGSRLSGIGYDPARDVIYYNGRNQAVCYAVSASTHELLGSFGLPFFGLENGEGIGVGPDGRVWVHIYELGTVSCFESDIPTEARSTTWGALKRRYLR